MEVCPPVLVIETYSYTSYSTVRAVRAVRAIRAIRALLVGSRGVRRYDSDDQNRGTDLRFAWQTQPCNRVRFPDRASETDGTEQT